MWLFWRTGKEKLSWISVPYLYPPTYLLVDVDTDTYVFNIKKKTCEEQALFGGLTFLWTFSYLQQKEF